MPRMFDLRLLIRLQLQCYRSQMFRALAWIFILLIVGAPACAHDHLEARLFMIRSQLAQAGPAPVVFGGDSIVESTLLPQEVCGHRVVNAGIGGTTTYQYALAVGRLDFRAAAFVVSVGTNDSTPASVSNFADQYRFLSKAISAKSDSVLYVGIPALEPGTVAETFDSQSSDAIENIIRDFAGRRFIDARMSLASIKQKTIDGVHLSPTAQKIWLDTVLVRLRQAIGC